MLTAEEKYRLLLEISEAANSQIEIAAVLEAVVEGLEPAIHVDALAVTTVHGDHLVPHAVYIRGVERRQGDSFADTLERWMRLSGGEFMAKPPGGLPLAGTGTEYVGQAGRAWICEDLAQGTRFPEDSRLLAAGIRSYVRVPLRVRDQFVGSLAFSAVRRAPSARGGRRLRSARPADRRRHGQRAGIRGDRAAQCPPSRREPGATPGDRRALDVRGDHRLLARPARDPFPGGQGGGHRHDGADHRRDRHRQGAGGAGHPRRSSRAHRALVAVNCAALPASLIASELFGHEKGAFTGALQRRAGRFELAAGGTIFLDEVGELTPEVQATLLRVLQEGTFERVGGAQPIATDARVIAATNRDLGGGRRRDLPRGPLLPPERHPHRLPPLRERKEDVPLLVEYFAARYAPRFGSASRASRRPMDRILAYSWPGNVRELQNVMERAAILSEGDVLRIDEPLLASAGGPPPPPPASPFRTACASPSGGGSRRRSPNPPAASPAPRAPRPSSGSPPRRSSRGSRAWGSTSTGSGPYLENCTVAFR